MQPQVIICKDRAEWLEARKDGLGASDAAALLGLGLGVARSGEGDDDLGWLAAKVGRVPVDDGRDDLRGLLYSESVILHDRTLQ